MKTFLKKQLSSNLVVLWTIINVLMFAALLKGPVKAKPFGDGDFHAETGIVAQVFWGEKPWSDISVSKAPGPVLGYAIPYIVAGPNASDQRYLFFARCWLMVLITLVHLLVYRFMARRFEYSTANLFMLFTFIIPLHIYYSLGIWAEGMAYIGVMIMLAAWCDIRIHRGMVLFFTGAVFLALARPNIALIFPGMWLFSYLYRKSAFVFSGKRFRTGVLI